MTPGQVNVPLSNLKNLQIILLQTKIFVIAMINQLIDLTNVNVIGILIFQSIIPKFDIKKV